MTAEQPGTGWGIGREAAFGLAALFVAAAGLVATQAGYAAELAPVSSARALAADAAPQRTLPPKAAAAERAPRALPPGLERALRVELPELTAAELRAAFGTRDRVALKIGTGRPIPGLSSSARLRRSLDWAATPEGGLSALLLVNSRGAEALRLGLVVEALPEEAELRFFDDELEAVESVSGAEVLATLGRNRAAGDASEEGATFWSPVIDGGWIGLEITLPPGTAPADLALGIAGVSHLLVSPMTGAGYAQLLKIGEAASCNLDVNCPAYSAWSTLSNAVARMIFTEGASSYLCTGTLLNDVPGSFTPYFLTANHCISTQTVASTLQTFWFYRSTSCGVIALNPASVTRTGGGALLYSSSSTDTTFMSLNSTPPAGAVYAGWTTALPNIGDGATGIHHPRGDLQKIALGSVTSFLNCSSTGGTGFSCSAGSQATSTFVNVTFTAGTTEGGSSGSGIFFNTGQQLFGQLYGGSSSCTNLAGSNVYGRFDRAYAQGGLAIWLNPAQSPLVALSNGVPVPGIGDAAGSRRFYYLDVPAGATNLSVTTSGGTGDVDLYVRRDGVPSLSTYDCRSWANTNNESCNFNNPAAGRYYALLSGFAAYANVTLTATYTGGATDTTPDAFSFTAQTGVALSSVRTSNTITPAGYNAAASISVSNGSYSIGCTGSFVTTASTINPGQTVCVRHTSAAVPATSTVTTLTIGGVNGTFTSTTAAALSITTASPLPNGTLGATYPGSLAATGGITPYSFTVLSGALPNGLTLNTNGTFSGAPTQSGVFNFTAQAVDSGGQTTTKAFALTVDDTVPDAFSFTPQTGVALSSVRTSNTITPAGYNAAAAISVSNGSYSVGCTATFTTSAGTINPGQSVCVRHTASSTLDTEVTTILTIGGVAGSFSSTTTLGGLAYTGFAAGSTPIPSDSNAAPTVVLTLPVVCPPGGSVLVSASGESAALSSAGGLAFIGLAYGISRDAMATDNATVVQSSALATFSGDANRDFLSVQRVDACTPGQTNTYRLTAYRTTPDTAPTSFLWNARLVASVPASAPGAGFAPATTFVASTSNAAPTTVATLAATCPSSGVLIVAGSGESAAVSSSAGTAFIGLAYSIARESTATDNGNVVQSSALARFNGDANRDFLSVQRIDACTPGGTVTYRLTAYRTTPETGPASFVWNGRLVAIDPGLLPADGFAAGTTAVPSSSNATPTVVTALTVVCPASGSVLVQAAGESAALSSAGGTAFIGLAYSLARDSVATDNGNVVQSSALATFNGDANRDFLNVQRVDACVPGQSSTYRLTAYRTTTDTSAASFVWNARVVAVPLPF